MKQAARTLRHGRRGHTICNGSGNGDSEMKRGEIRTLYDSQVLSTRVLISPSSENGLMKDSYVMTDKIVTVKKCILGERIGTLSKSDMQLVSAQLKIILGL